MGTETLQGGIATCHAAGVLPERGCCGLGTYQGPQCSAPKSRLNFYAGAIVQARSEAATLSSCNETSQKARLDSDKTTSGSDKACKHWERAANENHKFNGAAFSVPMMSCAVRLKWTVREAMLPTWPAHPTEHLKRRAKLHDAQPPL